MQLNEKDILTDLLKDTKSISGTYHQGVLESATDRIRNTFISLNNDQLNFQKQLFSIMNNKGYYQNEPARGFSSTSTAYQADIPQQMSVRGDFGIQRPY